jgi:hypothetical protein
VKLSLAIFVALLVSGCSLAPVSYDFHREDREAILFPPKISRNRSTASYTRVSIQSARKHVSEIPGCDIEGELISLNWHGRTAKVTLSTKSFFTVSADRSSTQVDRGTDMDPLLTMEKFRSALLDRQTKGCLTPEESGRLRRSMVENLPLPPVVAYFFLLGSYDVTGYFDLTPAFRMQVTSPIYPSGVAPSPDRLRGYETANYVFRSAATDNRVVLVLASATEVLIGGAPVEKHTLRNELPFSKSPGYFRLLFMAEKSSTDRVTRAILLSAPDQTRLALATTKSKVSAESFCGTFSVPDATCTIFPKNFGVSPELRVTVNGEFKFVRVGGFLQEVLNLEQPENGPPATLKVHRTFRGRLVPIKFDHSSADILRLVLLPGDEITY